MARTFNVRTLIEVAVQDERSGASMYKSMAGQTGNQLLKDAFADLAEQEEKHGKKFQEILDGMPPESEVGTTGYPDEYVDYLGVLVQRGGSEGSEPEIEGRDGRELVEVAMAFEQTQLNLQRDMATVLGSEFKNVVDQVIREEMGHLVMLNSILAELGR